MLADALPDRFGNAVIDAWLARRGRSADDFTPVERLCYTGKRAMGALEFEPALNPRLDESANVQIDDLVALASEVLREREPIGANIRAKPTDALLDIIRVGTSAGGMRPKAVVALDDSTGDLRTGQVRAPAGYGYWIMKLDGVRDDALGDPKGYGRIEYACCLMARRAGIEMMESRLLEEGGRAHFMTRRFDRTEAGDRLHLQSLCALEHFDTAIGEWPEFAEEAKIPPDQARSIQGNLIRL
jgi:serine/threonine-protein kinase HipA